eukprot:2856168-Pleurochrysis_carterae.AAC.2
MPVVGPPAPPAWARARSRPRAPAPGCVGSQRPGMWRARVPRGRARTRIIGGRRRCVRMSQRQLPRRRVAPSGSRRPPPPRACPRGRRSSAVGRRPLLRPSASLGRHVRVRLPRGPLRRACTALLGAAPLAARPWGRRRRW